MSLGLLVNMIKSTDSPGEMTTISVLYGSTSFPSKATTINMCYNEKKTKYIWSKFYWQTRADVTLSGMLLDVWENGRGSNQLLVSKIRFIYMFTYLHVHMLNIHVYFDNHFKTYCLLTSSTEISKGDWNPLLIVRNL